MRTELCGADGGQGLGAGHVCKCVGKKGHAPFYGKGHGCSCGAIWSDPEVKAEPVTNQRDEIARIIQMSCSTRMSDETARHYADNLVRSGYGKVPPPPAQESVEWEELCAATEALAAAALTFQNARTRYTAKYPKDSNAR